TALALEAYTQAIVVGENTDQPLAIDAYVARGTIYEARGQVALALADIAAAAEATDDPELRVRQLDLLVRAGELDTARTLVNRLREENDEVPRGAIDLAEARVIMGGDDPTDGDYQQAIDLISGNSGTIPADLQPLANLLRAEAHAELGNADNALNFAEQALATGGETARVRLVMGRAYIGLEEYAQAVAEFERALTLAEITVVPATLVAEADDLIFEAEGLLFNQQAGATETAQAR
ncbi:MAG: hypothetical protein AAF653_09400, partial [Chloroflexota bacterium]